VRTIRHRDSVYSLSFSPDGMLLATGSRDNTVRITNIEFDNKVRAIKHGGAVNSVSFSPDGVQIATGSDDKKVKISEI